MLRTPIGMTRNSMPRFVASAFASSSESREEMVEYTAAHFRRASEDVLRHAGQVLPSTQERSNAKRIVVVQEPIGVVAAVTPWNFPVDIAGIPAHAARAFVKRAQRVVAAGRPPCPLCGLPLDPEGHICVRTNGYLRGAIAGSDDDADS